jgi:anthranilate phosphoribosyltransferase
MVVHGNDGLDEISLSTSSRVIEVKDGELREYEIAPEDFGLAPASAADFLTADAKEATDMLERTLAGNAGAAGDVLELNAGAAIYVGGGADTLANGVIRAQEILVSGRALETIKKLRRASLGENVAG